MIAGPEKLRNPELNSEYRNRRLGEVAISAVNNEKPKLIGLEPRKSYEIQPDSRIGGAEALEELHCPAENLTTAAHYALRHNNIIAVVRAANNSFWLLDQRNDERFVKNQTPYLLIEPETLRSPNANNPNMSTKGIRLGDNLIFGRNNDYGGRFDYSDYVSGNHFEINCDPNGNLAIVDLDSANGTSLLVDNKL